MKKINSQKSILGGNRKYDGAVIKPQLTSLIDVMTILLVFLLKSFSTDGALISVPKDLSLAESMSKESPEEVLNLEITTEGVRVGGIQIMSKSEVADQDSMMLMPVFNELEKSLEKIPEMKRSGKILIQCDKSTDFKILKKVMYTAGRARLKDFSLLVVQRA